MTFCGLAFQVSPSDVIGSSTRPAAPRFGTHRRRWLASTSALRIPIASAALALGVALSGEAHAQATVNPVQTTTYNIRPASNPITFGSATNIDTSARPFSYAVVGGTGIDWNVTVLGGARISASLGGIYIRTQGTVTNSGQITAATSGIFAGAGVVSVINEASGTITGANFGVVGNTGSSLVNSGTIKGGATGVELVAGSVVNSGTINGTTQAGLYLFNGATVTNQAGGTITSSGHNAITLQSGGSVINQAGGTISGTAAPTNGILLVAGGSVTNAGTITGGADGVSARGGSSVVNSGAIYGGLKGVAIAASSVLNLAGGTISGGGVGGVYIGGSGTVTNLGTITSGNVGVVATNGGTVANAATIHGGYAGVDMVGTGSVTNQAGGTISGGSIGVRLGGGSVTNAGTITGTGGTAVLFAGSGNNTLILQTGSVLNGDAVGSTAAGATNALVLQGTGSANNSFLNFNTLDVQASGLWALNGVSTIGATTIDGGTLVVGDASHPTAALTSPVTVNAGGALAGQGTLIGNVAVLAGGAIAPGAASPYSTLNVTGNASFASASLYQVNINGSTGQSDKLVLSGAATLSGGAVQVTYSGSLSRSSYDILHAAGGLGSTTFAGVSSNLTGFGYSLSYSPTDVFFNLTSAQLGSGAGLNRNQQNVANAINNFFNAGGTLPAGFAPLFGLTGANLGNALSQLSGEAPTGAQQSAFQLMDGFLGLTSDPQINGGGGTGVGALPFAPERSSLPPDLALAYAKAMKAPPGQGPMFDQRWNVWGSAFGGGNRTDGDPVTGSHDVSATAAGVAAGADYRLAPNTKLGFALAGGSTNWTLSQGLGSGHGDAVMIGVYGKTYYGPAYLTGSLAAAEHWVSTDRMALGDHLTAHFDAQSYGGRIEGGYRFATAFGGIAPYAAAQFQSFRMPAYAETDLAGGGFGLAYAARNATDTRSELGGRFDREIIPWQSDEVVTLTARVAWAHDWVSNPTLAASFQALPGQSFLVNGAAPAKDSALASTGAEVCFASNWSIAAKFDGEFAVHSTTYAGTGVLRYRW